MTLIELASVALLTILAGWLLDLPWWTVALLTIATVAITNAVRVWLDERG